MNDAQWAGLHGGYRVPYDPRPALARLKRGDTLAWDELWQELHHQGDVGDASYAAVPELVRIQAARGGADWNTFALAATIEEARRSGRNPKLPGWLVEDHKAAWDRLGAMALAAFPSASGDELISSILAVLAWSKDKASLGCMAMLTEDERQEMLDQIGWG